MSLDVDRQVVGDALQAVRQVGGDALEANKQVVRDVLVASDRGDFDAIARCFADDYVDRSHRGSREGGDKAAALSAFREIAAAFPDSVHEIHFLVAEGDKVVLRVSATGTHTGAFRGIPATERRVTLTETVTYTIRNGRIAERWSDGGTSIRDALGALADDPSPVRAGGRAPLIRRNDAPITRLMSGASFWEVALEGVSLTWFELDPGVRFETHAHPNEQITLVLEGELIFEVDGETHAIGAGDAIAIPGGVEHAVSVGSAPCRAVDAWSPPQTHLDPADQAEKS